jgi:hypothetical protein
LGYKVEIPFTNLRESADHNHCCVARCISSGQGILLQQRDVAVSPEREYMLSVRSAMANAGVLEIK